MVRTLTILAVLCSPAPSFAQTYFDLGPATYHTCYDGDTCMMSLLGVHPFFGDHILIRINGIDTPEIKGHCEREKLLARQARDYVRSLLEPAKEIRLLNPGRDKYFRIDAEILADGQNVGRLLLEKGYAVPYDGGTKTVDWCTESSPSSQTPPPPDVGPR